MRIDYKNQKLLNEEEVSQQDVQFAVEQTKLELQSNLLATKRCIAEKENQLSEIKTTFPLDCEKYAQIRSELTSYRNGLRYLEELQKDLGFTD